MWLIRIAWVAVLLAACGREPDLATGPRAARTGVNDSLTLTATVAPTTISPGDTAWLTVTLANRLNRAVTLEFGSSCQLLYYAEDANGQPAMDNGGYMCLGVITHMRLAPREVRQGRFGWTAMEFTYPPPGYRDRPAGTYRLYGILGDLPEGSMRSAPVEVVVR